MAKTTQSKAKKNVVVKDLTPKDSGAVQGGTIVAVNGGGNTPAVSQVTKESYARMV